MGGLDAEAGRGGGVARPRFGAAHGLGTYLFVLVAQWTAGYMVVYLLMTVAAVDGRNINDPRVIDGLMAKAIAPTMLAHFAVLAFFTLLSLRVFAWHLVRDRTPAGLGLFVPPARQLLFWSAIGILLGAVHTAAVRFVPAASEQGTMSTLAGQTTIGHVAWVASSLVTPFLSALLHEGLALRGMIESWGVKAASVTLVLLYVAGSAMDAGGNWSALIAALVYGVAAVAARLHTGSLIASFAVSQLYVVTLTASWYALTPSR